MDPEKLKAFLDAYSRLDDAIMASEKHVLGPNVPREVQMSMALILGASIEVDDALKELLESLLEGINA